MDQKQFTSRLVERTGLAAASVNAMTECMARIFAENGSELDSIAIPGFGTFATEKHDESVSVDPASGDRVLMPPVIKMEFKPSILLRKKL